MSFVFALVVRPKRRKNPILFGFVCDYQSCFFFFFVLCRRCRRWKQITSFALFVCLSFFGWRRVCVCVCVNVNVNENTHPSEEGKVKRSCKIGSVSPSLQVSRSPKFQQILKFRTVLKIHKQTEFAWCVLVCVFVTVRSRERRDVSVKRQRNTLLISNPTVE